MKDYFEKKQKQHVSKNQYFLKIIQKLIKIGFKK